MNIRIICRNSRLSLRQTNEIVSLFPELRFSVIPADTLGDKNKNIPLDKCDIPDFFTRELDEAVQNETADIAIHSAKDLPYPIPEGLEVIALTEAQDKNDVLVTLDKKTLKELHVNPRIGTSSSSRENGIKQLRPDAEIISIRGTIEERLELIDKGKIDGIVVATCALKRLNLEDRITEVLPFRTHPLQGNLAVVARKNDQHLKEIFRKADIRTTYGKAYLVGFGPGDPELLTLKAYRVLKSCDIIFHDDLVDKLFLQRFEAKKIYVGKRKENHSHSQDEINELLYRAVISGKNTVRLKGGDPFIFGRGGEEFRYLHSRLIEPEVIPGITSAIGAAADAAIPLTQRGESSSVAFVSASGQYIQVPSAETLVYYMGASNIETLRTSLLKNKISPETPVAITTNATLFDSNTVFTDVGNLNEDFPSPSIIIIGPTVKNLNIMKKEPNTLVTGLSTNQYHHLGNIIHQPLIEIDPVEMPCEFFSMLLSLYKYDYIVFTSRNAVHHFMNWLHSTDSKYKKLSENKIVAIGQITSEELAKHDIKPHLIPETDSSNGIVKMFRDKNITNTNILIPRSDIALNVLPEGLRDLGNSVDIMTVYYTRPVKHINKVDLNRIDNIVFSSPSGVRSFLKHYGEIPLHVKVITRGEQTQNTYEQLSAL